jgi:protein involved in polysaccharide export with SLBB domain
MKSNNSFESSLKRLLPLVKSLLCVVWLSFGHEVIQAQAGTQSVVAKNAEGASVDSEEEYYKAIYRNFYLTYRLGPGDEISIRVLGQPDYSFSKIKVSPVGRIYHPLVGETEVVGTTVPQLEKKLTIDFSEFIINPKVNVSLEEAQSAKIGVLGEVKAPAVLVMARPMTILDAINSSGGFLDTANRSDVVLLRQGRDGRLEKITVNLKKYFEGKAGAEENLTLRAGDTVFVSGNMRKKMSTAMNSLNFASFLSFVVFGRG